MAEPVINTVDLELLGEMQFQVTTGSGGTFVLQPSGPNPMEALLAALGGCAGMDVVSLLRKKRQHLTGYRIEVQGERAEQHPRVFTAITMRHLLQGDNISSEAVEQILQLVENKYCPALAMLAQAATITSSFEITSEPPRD